MGSDDVFDVIQIDAGPVGETAARRAVPGVLRSAVVERGLVGGEWSYCGALPTPSEVRLGLPEAYGL